MNLLLMQFARLLKGAVVETDKRWCRRRGLWSYKPEPWVNPGVTEKVEEVVEETLTTEELLEEISRD